MTREAVANTTELQVGEHKPITVGGEKALLFRLEDGFYATAARCTHVFANLNKGKLVEGCQIQCPLHRARFDVRTGEVVEWANFPPGIQVLSVVRSEKALKTYPVTVDGETVFVEA